MKRVILIWTIGTTIVGEFITVIFRIVAGHSAAQFNESDPPFLLQIHHLFWSLPFFLAAVFVRNRKARGILMGIGLGCILSDLIHHFVVLPIWKGNTGWHWP